MIREGIGKYMVILVVIGIALGITVGWSSAGVEILNPRASEAAAAQSAVVTAYMAERNEIELGIYRQDQALKMEAAKIRVESDLATYQALNQLKVTMIEVGGYVVIGMIAYLIALSSTLYLWHRFHELLDRKEEAVRRHKPDSANPRPIPTLSVSESNSTNNGQRRVPIRENIRYSHIRA